MKNKLKELIDNKDSSIIPKGDYCYEILSIDKKDGRIKIKLCPYWSCKSNLPKQENGYCSFLETGDYERNQIINHKLEIFNMDGKSAGETVAEKFGEHFPSSLLWDQCKECNENIIDNNFKDDC